MKNIKYNLMYLKFLFSRGNGYLNLINTSMILIIFLRNFNLDLRKYYIPLMILGIFLLLSIGYIEDKLELYKAEIDVIQKKNTKLNNILNSLDRIESKLK